jgi:hypothetical protein
VVSFVLQSPEVTTQQAATGTASMLDGEQNTLNCCAAYTRASAMSAVYPDGRVCISILHNPGDDPNGYETAAERWSPVQSVRHSHFQHHFT